MFLPQLRIPWKVFMPHQSRGVSSSFKNSLFSFCCSKANFKNSRSCISTYLALNNQRKEGEDVSSRENQKMIKITPIQIQKIKSISKETETSRKKLMTEDLTDWTPIYKCEHIVGARLVQRFKIGQTIFTILIAAPLAVAGFYHELVDVTSVYLAVGGSAFASFMLYIVGNFFSRLIGFMYVSKYEDPIKTVRIARLNFWGGRVDEYIPIENIVPFSDYIDNHNVAYIKVKQYVTDEEDDHFNLTLKYGTVLEETEFQLIFGNLSQDVSTKRK